MRLLLFLASLTILAVPGAARACPGDCDGDGRVSVDELLHGVSLALTNAATVDCAVMDFDGDGVVTVSDLVQAVRAALAGCPPTPTPTPSAPPTSTATSLPTSTPTINLPPIVPAGEIYRGYPGFPIAVDVGAVDPDGGAVGCAAEGLPPGAQLDAASQTFTWTPAEGQLGPYHLPFLCSDDGVPPASVEGQLTLQVSPLDACTTPECDPAVGCVSPLPPLNPPCCTEEPIARVAEAVADCPQGRVAFVGGNTIGFGRLQNCDILRVRNFAQSGAEVRFHVESRCLDTNNRVTVHARMETSERILFDASQAIFLDMREDGYTQRLFLRFNVESPGPFFDLQDAEANLRVTLTDGGGASASESLRLRLTFTPIPDLPEAEPDPVPPTPTALP